MGTTHAADAEVGNKNLGLPFKGRLDDLRIYRRQLTKDEIAHSFNQEPLRAILNILPDKRSKDQTAWIRNYYLTNAAPAETARRGRN